MVVLDYTMRKTTLKSNCSINEWKTFMKILLIILIFLAGFSGLHSVSSEEILNTEEIVNTENTGLIKLSENVDSNMVEYWVGNCETLNSLSIEQPMSNPCSTLLSGCGAVNDQFCGYVRVEDPNGSSYTIVCQGRNTEPIEN